MLGIYVHIPFCKSKCGYCDFYSISSYNEKLMDSYLNALLAQISDYFKDKRSVIQADTIYFGGGTPSVFGGKRIARVLNHIRKLIEVVKHAEITVEANPESCDKAFCKQVKAAGVNRLSLGVQSSNDGELLAVGRLHSYNTAKAAVATAKKYLTDNISLDLIYGLPGQTMDTWCHSVRDIMELEPTHISCYGLKLEPGCPMYGKSLDLADDDTQADMYLKCIDMLGEKGYEQYEISNFCKLTKISRHNSKYWDLTDYIGFGAGAASYYLGKRFTFVSDIEGYIDGVLAGTPVLEEADELALPNNMRVGEYIMLMLRTTRGIDVEGFYRLFGREFNGQVLEPYIARGFAVYNGSRYYLTPKGFLISNTIISSVLEGL